MLILLIEREIQNPYWNSNHSYAHWFFWNAFEFSRTRQDYTATASCTRMLKSKMPQHLNIGSTPEYSWAIESWVELCSELFKLFSTMPWLVEKSDDGVVELAVALTIIVLVVEAVVCMVIDTVKGLFWHGGEVHGTELSSWQHIESNPITPPSHEGTILLSFSLPFSQQ